MAVEKKSVKKVVKKKVVKSPKVNVWILKDDRRGTTNQCIGVCEFLGYGYKEKELSYSKLIKYPNFIRKIFGLGITEKCKKALLKDIKKEGYPDLIIAGGRRPAPVSVWIKKLARKNGGAIKIVHLMNPNMPYSKFDLVCLPKHDSNVPKLKKVYSFATAPHKMNAKFVKEQAAKWNKVFAKKKLKKPLIGLIIGGSTKNRKFSVKMAEELGEKANELAKTLKGSLLITTSRRTGEKQEKALMAKIDTPNYFYGWGNKDENPIFGYYACADLHIITGESVSMCSEALINGAPVFAYDNEKLLSPKHKRFIKNLYKGSPAKSFYKIPKKPNLKKVKGVNSAEDIAKVIQKKIIK